MLTGRNSILTQAKRAKEETDKASVIEQAQTDILGIQAGGDTTLTKEQLKEVLDKYFESVPDDVDTDDILTTKDEYGGKYQIAVSDIYSGEFKELSIPSGLEIGSIVNYNPNGEYTWKAKYYSSDKSDKDVVLDSSTADFKIDTWKVFDMNEASGEITLVPMLEKKIDGSVYLQGAQGYNNAIYLLNEACSYLYGDSSKGITARSINIEDIEEKMTDDAVEEIHNFYSPNNIKYGQQALSAFSRSNSNYPSVYAREKSSVVDGKTNSSGWDVSQQTELIEPNDNIIGTGYLQASSIQPYQTYWDKDSSFMQTAFKTAKNGTNYYDLIFPQGTNTYYWIASRCINNSDEYSCNFGIKSINEGKVSYGYMFNSGGNDLGETYYHIFPIVSLNSKLLTGNATDGFSVK